MPTYRVRTDIGEGFDDAAEMEFRDRASACRDAKVAMTEIAREVVPEAEQAKLCVEIDDDEGQAIYRAEMDFKGQDGGQSEAAPNTAEQLSKGPRD